MTTETINIASPQPAPVAAPATVAVEAPVVTTPAPAAVAETATVQPTTALAQPAPTTVLGEAVKPQPAPVTEQPKQQDSQGGQSAEPASPPVYEAFKLPENVTLDNERITQFTSLLADLEIKNKTDHAAVQEFGQKMVDFHLNEIQNREAALQKQWSDNWEKQKNDWKESFLKDPQIGGPQFQATVDSAVGFIRTHGGTPEQQTEFRNLMETSGLGNHPAMIRLLANAGRAMSEGKPLASVAPVSPAKSKMQTLYGALAQ